MGIHGDDQWGAMDTRKITSMLFGTLAVVVIVMLFAHENTESVKEEGGNFLEMVQALKEPEEAGGQYGMPSSIVAMVNAREHRYALEKKHQYMKALLGNTDEGDDDDKPIKEVDELAQGQTMSDFSDEFNQHVNAFSWSHAASDESFQQDGNEAVQHKVVKKKKVAAPTVEKVEEEREEADEPFSESGPMARFLAKQQAHAAMRDALGKSI